MMWGRTPAGVFRIRGVPRAVI